MSVPRKFLFYPLLFLLSQCTEDADLFTRDYPIIVTEEVINISPEGALFSATVLNQGKVPIDDHGFVWGTFGGSLDIAFSERKSLGSLQGDKFEAVISSTLETDKDYHVRCYVKVGTKEIYGPKVFFKSLGSKGPQIISFSPTEAKLLDTLLIVGKNFSYLRHVNKVKVNEIDADILDATDTLIKVQIPIALEESSATVSVSVQGNKSVASEQLKLKAPSILAVSKNKIKFCDTLMLTISPVHPSTLSVMKVSFNDANSTPFKMEGNSKIFVMVPAIPPTNLVTVKLKLKKAESLYQTQIELKIPSITSADSSPKTYGDTITFNADYIPECSLLAMINGSSTPFLKTPGKNTIKVIVPYSVRGSEIKATLLSEQFVLTENIFQRYVKIESILPNEGTFGESVLIKGKGFHPELTEAKINDIISIYNGSNSSGYYFIVPFNLINLGANGGLVNVNVTVDGVSEIKVNAYRYLPPVVNSIFQDERIIGLVGSNFNPNREFNKLKVGNYIRSANYASSSDLLFSFEIPQDSVADKYMYKSEVHKASLDVNGQTISTTTNCSLSYFGPWTQLSDFPGQERSGAIIFNADGYIYYGMGKNHSGEALKDFWKYSIDFNEWSRLNDFPGQARFNSSIFKKQDLMHLAFGENSTQLFDEEWFYHSVVDAWIKVGNSPAGPNSRLIPLNFDYYQNGNPITLFTGGTLGSTTWGYGGGVSGEWKKLESLPIEPTNGITLGYSIPYVFNSASGTYFTFDPLSRAWIQGNIFDAIEVNDFLFTDFGNMFTVNSQNGKIRELYSQNEFVSRLPDSDQPVYAIYHRFSLFHFLKGTKLFSFDLERYSQVK